MLLILFSFCHFQFCYVYGVDSFIELYKSWLNYLFFILGIFFTSYWKRYQNDLAYEWDTKGYETMELDRVQYSEKLQKYRIEKNNLHAEFSRSLIYFKKIISFLILVLMV